MHIHSKQSTSLHGSPQPNAPCPTTARMFDSAAEFQIKRSNIANIAGTSVNYFPVIIGGTQNDQDRFSTQSTVAMRVAAELQNVQNDDALPPSRKFEIKYSFRRMGPIKITAYSLAAPTTHRECPPQQIAL